ncbi:hypothetical protein QUB63_32630 [Microcoleus sp. ARI1-B5]|uniref:hypothetical protein n=1 Tax=unclassified Microcoleus TaxID=2642155 RepID=UPI002FD44519
MTKNGWCRTNYHSDGKRRFGKLTNRLCNECHFSGEIGTCGKALDKITGLQEKINDLEEERDRLCAEIDRLRSKLQTLIKSLRESEKASVNTKELVKK